MGAQSEPWGYSGEPDRGPAQAAGILVEEADQKPNCQISLIASHSECHEGCQLWAENWGTHVITGLSEEASLRGNTVQAEATASAEVLG